MASLEVEHLRGTLNCVHVLQNLTFVRQYYEVCSHIEIDAHNTARVQTITSKRRSMDIVRVYV